MTEFAKKDYIIVVQCDIVQERCSGYLCEKSFNERSGGFAIYSKDKHYRTIYLTCGGCCGRAIHRKLGHIVQLLKIKESIEKDRIVVQFSSCITTDNYHGPPCPHLDYLRALVAKLGLDLQEKTYISKTSEKLRKAGVYAES